MVFPKQPYHGFPYLESCYREFPPEGDPADGDSPIWCISPCRGIPYRGTSPVVQISLWRDVPYTKNPLWEERHPHRGTTIIRGNLPPASRPAPSGPLLGRTGAGWRWLPLLKQPSLGQPSGHPPRRSLLPTCRIQGLGILDIH